MKKIVKGIGSLFLILLLLVLGSLIFLLNSPQATQQAVQKYAPQYGFSYQQISGGLLTGLEIKGLTFREHALVDTLKLSWNPALLLYKNLSITELEATQIDVETVKNVIKTFVPHLLQEEEGAFVMPLSVGVKKLHLSIKPFSQSGIHFRQITVDGSRLAYTNGKRVDVEQLKLLIDTNLSKLAINARVEGDSVLVDSLSLQEIDTVALTKLFASSEDNGTKAGDDAKVASSKKSIDTAANPLLPKYLIVKHLNCTIKSVTYDRVMIKVAEVNASEVKFDLQALAIQSGKVDIRAKTSFGDLNQHGIIQNNHLSLNGNLRPYQPLFDTYYIPVNAKTLNDATVGIHVDEKKVLVDLAVDGKNILKVKKGMFNLEDTRLDSHLIYQIPEGVLKITSDGNITTRYTKKSRLQSLVTYENNTLTYSGQLVAGKIEGIDSNFTKPLNNLKITYQGTGDGIVAQIDSAGLGGTLLLPDYQHGDFNLSTKKPIALKDILSLPQSLKSAWVDMAIDAPLDFAKTAPPKAKATIRSNLANVDADIFYDKELKVLTKTIFPKDSLLKGLSKELNLNALSPLETTLVMNEKRLAVDVKSNGLTSKVTHNLENKNLDGDLVLGGAKFIFSGNVKEEVKLENRVDSLQNLIKKIRTIYAFEPLPLDGDMKLSLTIKKMKELELLLTSQTLTYDSDKTAPKVINDTMISLGFVDSVLKLNRYHTTFQKQKIFATKPSKISFKDGNIEIVSLWINDEIKVTGIYNVENKKGEILANADIFTLSSEMIDLSSKVDIKTKFDGINTAIDGVVTILDSDVHYDLEQKSFVADSDIIIVQNIKKKEPNPFMDHLTTTVKVNTVEPLVYKSATANIKAKVDLLVQKAPGGALYVLGTTEILADSFYLFEEKKFVLKKSLISFVGDPSKPILDIAAVYRSLNYDITIQITGNPSTPNIIFSSVPSLSRDEILSVILFGSEEGAGSNSGDEMMKMMGGAMAKSALANAGIKIDYLSLGADGNMEVGKKLSDKITIIYVNDDVAGAKLQYDYSKRIKATLSTDAESSGVDIIYKREFKDFKEFK